MIYLQIFLITLFIGVVILYILGLINQMIYRVPHVSTFNSDLNLLREVFGKYKLRGKKTADLGSGTGKILRLLETEFKAQATGYEIDLSNVLIAKFLNKVLHSKTKIIKGNYLLADLQEFEIIYIYLFPCLMERVEERIFSYCTKGTIIIINAFPFKNHKPVDVFLKNEKEKIFVYEV